MASTRARLLKHDFPLHGKNESVSVIFLVTYSETIQDCKCKGSRRSLMGIVRVMALHS